MSLSRSTVICAVERACDGVPPLAPGYSPAVRQRPSESAGGFSGCRDGLSGAPPGSSTVVPQRIAGPSLRARGDLDRHDRDGRRALSP